MAFGIKSQTRVSSGGGRRGIPGRSEEAVDVASRMVCLLQYSGHVQGDGLGNPPQEDLVLRVLGQHQLNLGKRELPVGEEEQTKGS